MASLALGAAGAVVGGFLGGPLGASIGWSIGAMVGNLLDPPKVEGPRLSDLKLQISEYGKPIPIFYGTMRIAGNVIWIGNDGQLVEHEEKSGGKGGPQVTNWTYSASWAIQLCANEISEITRVWADGRLVWSGPQDDDDFAFTIYYGTEEQLPDPTMEADKGAGNVPGYRGTAYVVFDTLYLTDFGNRLPQLAFEVSTTGRPQSAIRLVKENTDTTYAPSTRIKEEWEPDISDDTPLDPPPTELAAVVYYERGEFPAEYAYRAELVGGHVVEDDVAYTLWAVFGNVGPSGGASPFGLMIGSPTDGGDALTAWGIESGRYFYGISVTKDYRVVLVFTGPVPDSGGSTADTWHRIRHGVVEAFGTCDPPLGKDAIGWGNVSVYSTRAANSLELNGRWMWYVNNFTVPTQDPGSDGGRDFGPVIVYHIDDADNFARFEDAHYGYPMPVTPTIEGGSRASILCVADGYAGTVCAGQAAIWSRYSAAPQGVPLSEIVADISLRTGALTHYDYDVEDLTDIVFGYHIANQMECRNAIQPLREAYFFDGIEHDDIVLFRKRGKESIGLIPDADLAAHEFGEQTPAPVNTLRTDEPLLPRVVNTKYINQDADFQIATQIAQRQIGRAEGNVTLDLPIAMDDQKGRAIANSQLWSAWIERERFTFSTSRKWSRLEPTDVIDVHNRTVRIIDKREAPNGVIRFEAVPSRADVYAQPAVAITSTGFPDQAIRAKPATVLHLLDIPLIDDGDTPNGFYIAMGPAAAGPWSGAALFKSTDGGSTYTQIASTETAATIGTADTILGDFGGGNLFDVINTVTVVLTSGELSSATELAVLNGANAAVVGLEIIQFKNADLIDVDTYELSGLLRGRRGTEWAIRAHAIGERFVLLPVMRLDAPAAELFQTRTYKAVTYGKTLASATAVDFANMGQALRPYSPVDVGGGSDASGNAILSWKRRTRTGGAWVDFVDASLGESAEGYVVQIWDSTYAQCARIISGLTAQTTTYSAANQVTDFGATQAHIYFTVGQTGTYQLGVQTRGVVPGIGLTDDDPITPITPYNGDPTVPPPPSGGEPGVVQTTLIYPADIKYSSGFKIGDRWVAKFTVNATPPVGIFSAEALDTPPVVHHVRLCSDIDGLVPYANGEQWGIAATVYFGSGPGQCNVPASVDVYAFITCQLPDGSPSGPLGRIDGLMMTLNAGAAP